MGQLQLCFLGGLKIWQDDEPHHDALPKKALALLCFLAVTSEAQSRNKLASLLWSDFAEDRARSNLRDTLTLLRRTPLAPYVDIGRQLISFNQKRPYWLDTAQFQKDVESGIIELPTSPLILETAVSLYTGEFIEGFLIPKASLFEEWTHTQRQQLHLLIVNGLQKIVGYHLDADRFETGIPFAQRLLNLEPWHEQTHRDLMLLQWQSGDHHAALHQYELCQQILMDELSVVPSPETHTLYRNIQKQLDNPVSEGKIQIGPYPISHNIPYSIPGRVTPFIGREKEQRAIDNVLRDRTGRLITIFGAGGTGKTRLATAVGEKQAQTIERDGSYLFPDGVFFVPLEAVESETEIIPAICHALDFQPAKKGVDEQSAETELLAYLRHKQLLLIIDNFEHLLAGVNLLAKIHRFAPGVHLLITTRQKLGLHGERLYALEGLHYPDIAQIGLETKNIIANYSAVALFVTCAQRVQPDFQLFDEEMHAIIRLCQLVDGLPLAIELAAGWVTVLSLDDIVAEIEKGLSFLESDLYDLPKRHRNMEAVFDVSWYRLDQLDQKRFAQLCIFRGGFSRQAAERVVGATVKQLAALVNKALIQYDRKLNRYQVHRLLRQFGAGKLAESQETEKAVREKHCAYFCAILQQWDKQSRSSEQLEALATLERESANVRAAWRFVIDTNILTEIDLAADGLGRLYMWRRHFHAGKQVFSAARETLLQALPLEGGANTACIKRILAKIQVWQSVFCERTEAHELIEETTAVLNSKELATVDIRYEQAFCLQRAGDLAFNADGNGAWQYYQQSLVLYQEMNNEWSVVNLLVSLGWEEAHHRKIEEAQRLGLDALPLARKIGDQKQVADVLWLLGTSSILQGDVEESSRLLGESLDIREKLGDRVPDIMAGPLDLGMTLTWIGRMTKADAVREEALALYKAQGTPEQIAMAHMRLSTSKIHVGDFEATEHHAQISLEMSQKTDNQRGVGLSLWLLGWVSLLDDDPDKAEKLLQESLSIFRNIEGAAEMGWVLGLLAEAVRQQGNLTAAKRYICEAFRIEAGVLGMITILECIFVYMNLLADAGEAEKVIEIGVLIEKYPVMRSPGAQAFYVDRLAQTNETLPHNIVAEAIARGQVRDLQETVAEILMELNETVMI